MTRREPHWVKLFLNALAASGNVRVAAERAGADFSTAYQRRKRHAGFAEAWEAALAVFQERAAGQSTAVTPPPLTLRQAQNERSPSPLFHSGEELVRADGTVIRDSPARWGKRAEGAFLMALTAGSNVRMAAQHAGFSTQAAYKRRLKDRHFAHAWDAAIESGRARVHAYLIEAATRTFDPDELPVADEGPTVSIGEAINIAKLGGGVAGRAGRAASVAISGDDPEFDGTPITRDEWEQAKENLVARLGRLRERMEAGPKCEACGQPMPYPDDARGHPSWGN